MKYSFFYLIELQYLGYRYHGWMLQKELKTVQLMVEKTLRFVLQHEQFKTLGSSRTDAKVSANHSSFELFIHHALDEKQFITDFNYNLPPDIRALSIQKVDARFNVIQAPKTKEYIYLFAHSQKAHPFSAPFLASFPYHLDVSLMQKGAKLFEGTHRFRQYVTKPSAKTNFDRTVLASKIEKNHIFTANFFPEPTFVYRVAAKGFMRNQVRLMMGQLLRLGKGGISLSELETSLIGNNTTPLPYIAPASGLILNTLKINHHGSPQ